MNPLPEIVELKGRAPRIEDWAEFFELIALNTNMTEACRIMGLHRGTVLTRIENSDDLTRQYLVARARRADELAEKVILAADAVIGGTLDPKRASVANDAYRWAASQMNPNAWGQSNSKVELTGKGGKDLVQQVVIFQLPDNDRALGATKVQPMLNISPGSEMDALTAESGAEVIEQAPSEESV